MTHLFVIQRAIVVRLFAAVVQVRLHHAVTQESRSWEQSNQVTPNRLRISRALLSFHAHLLIAPYNVKLDCYRISCIPGSRSCSKTM